MTDHITLPRIDYSVVQAYCDTNKVSYNEACAMVRAALAGAAQAEPVAWVPVIDGVKRRPIDSKAEAEEITGLGGAVIPLYAEPQPAQPVAVPAPGEFTVSEYPLPLESGFATRRYGIRVTHRSGVYAECGTSRSQHANKQKAWEMVVERLNSEPAPTPPAATVPVLEPLTDEQDRALCEAYCNTASDEFFKARPSLDTPENRRIFYAGHRKAWIERDAAKLAKRGGV